jgi:hypothetical protein
MSTFTRYLKLETSKLSTLFKEHDRCISGFNMRNMLNPIETCKTCNGNTQSLKLEPYFEHYPITQKALAGYCYVIIY